MDIQILKTSHAVIVFGIRAILEVFLWFSLAGIVFNFYSVIIDFLPPFSRYQDVIATSVPILVTVLYLVAFLVAFRYLVTVYRLQKLRWLPLEGRFENADPEENT